MKAKPSAPFRWLALSLLFAVSHAAQAFQDPIIGRWINRDPIGENGGINLYQFCYSNPISIYDPLGELPPSSPVCQAFKRRIGNLENEVAKRHRELYEDPLGLPGTVPADDVKPSLSRSGHQKLLNMAKANLAAARALYQATCNDPEPPKLQQCLDKAARSVPGTPQQLEQAGEISLVIGEIAAAGAGAGAIGGGIRIPRPAPPGFSPFPVPALP